MRLLIRYITPLLFFAALLGWFILHTLSSRDAVQSLRAEERVWFDRIEEIGGIEAYAEFAKSIDGEPPEDQHRKGHYFGGALYEALGKDGFSVCDDRFNFSCYHEFLGRAIRDLGLSSVVELNAACFYSKDDSGRNRGLVCQHGIGHGIAATLGYEEVDLKKALEVCEGLPFIDPIGGCYGGVFMEYNLRTMLGDGGGTRSVAVNNWMAPCDSLKREYQSACYFNQPQWWIVLMQDSQDTKKEFAQAGERCERIEEKDLLQKCFEGIGNVAAPSGDFTPQGTRELCDVSSKISLHRLFCKATAANSLSFGGAGFKGDGLGVCKGLIGAQYDYCEAYSKNQHKKAPPLSEL